jgi:hypothetical protein
MMIPDGAPGRLSPWAGWHIDRARLGLTSEHSKKLFARSAAFFEGGRGSAAGQSTIPGPGRRGAAGSGLCAETFCSQDAAVRSPRRCGIGVVRTVLSPEREVPKASWAEGVQLLARTDLSISLPHRASAPRSR